jgi:hypothetical protein
MVSDREPPWGLEDVGGYFNVPVQTVSSWNRQNLMRRYQMGKHVRYGPEDVSAFDDELLEQMDDGPDRPRGLKNVRWSAALRRAEEVMGAPKIAPGIQLHVGARRLLAASFFAAARFGYDDVWTMHQLRVMRLNGLAGVAARLKRDGDIDAALALEGVISTQKLGRAAIFSTALEAFKRAV